MVEREHFQVVRRMVEMVDQAVVEAVEEIQLVEHKAVEMVTLHQLLHLKETMAEIVA